MYTCICIYTNHLPTKPQSLIFCKRDPLKIQKRPMFIQKRPIQTQKRLKYLHTPAHDFPQKRPVNLHRRDICLCKRDPNICTHLPVKPWCLMLLSARLLCVCIHICIREYIHIDIYMYISMYTHKHNCNYVLFLSACPWRRHICTCVYVVNMCICTHLFVHTHTNIRVSTHDASCSCAHVCCVYICPSFVGLCGSIYIPFLGLCGLEYVSYLL